MNIKAQPRNKKKHIHIFFIMLSLHQLLYVFLCIYIYYANATPPIEQVMEKLIKLISDEQVNRIRFLDILKFFFKLFFRF